MSDESSTGLTPDLLAKLAAAERRHRRLQWRAVVILAVSVILAVAGVIYVTGEMSRARPAKVVIDPAKLPPIRPGPAP